MINPSTGIDCENRSASCGEKWQDFFAPKYARPRRFASICEAKRSSGGKQILGRKNAASFCPPINYIGAQAISVLGFKIKLAILCLTVCFANIGCSTFNKLAGKTSPLSIGNYRFDKESDPEKATSGTAEKESARAWEEAEKARKAAIQANLELERLRAELVSSKKMASENGQIEDPQRIIFEEYIKDLSNYHRKLNEGISLEERFIFLRSLLAKYNKKGIDLSAAVIEFAAIRQERESNQDAYRFSVKYYQEIIKRGATFKERREIIERIIEKYRPTGIDISEVEAELRQLSVDKK